jgi:hypothetical protein
MRPLRHSAFANAVPIDGRGHRRPETLAAIDRRDVLIAEAATVFFSTASANEAAHRLHTALARYESGAWRRERSMDACPPRHTGRLAAYCWQILRARDRVPSARLIRSILATFRCQRGVLTSTDHRDGGGAHGGL